MKSLVFFVVVVVVEMRPQTNAPGKERMKKKKRRKAAGMKNQSRTTYNKLFQLKKKEKGKCSQPTLSDTGGFLNLECDVCVCGL